MQSFLKKYSFHLLALVGFLVLSLVYASPVLQGKIILMSDPIQGAGASREVTAYFEKTGEHPAWTNSMFGGMPAYTIGGTTSQNFFSTTYKIFSILPGVVPNCLFLYMLGAYLLLNALGAKRWLAVIGSLAYAFFSLNVVIIEVGHLSKVFALALAPIVLAGVIWTLNGKRFLGILLFTLALGYSIFYRHVQIVYYTGLMVGIYLIYQAYQAWVTKTLKNYIIGLVLMGFASIFAAGTSASMLWQVTEYGKESIRGGSELKAKKNQTGLDIDYAFDWSYGKLESLTLLIPNFIGGASGQKLDTNSETFKYLTSNGVPEDQAEGFVSQAPTYWGEQQFTSGTVYAGAIICFLFVLGILIVDRKYSLPFIITALLFLVFSWGKNFPAFNNFIFEHFPGYNKFRAVTMILSLVQLLMIVVGVLALKKIIDSKPTFAEIKKPFFIALASTAGLCLVFWLLPTAVLDFKSARNDGAIIEQYKQMSQGNEQFAKDLYNSLLADRKALTSSDSLRSLFFICLVAGLILAFIWKKINEKVLLIGISVLVLFDLFSVAKRYLNDDSFQEKITLSEMIPPSTADQSILKDTSQSYRVINLTTSFTNESKTSYFHKSIGGYSPVKMGKFADVVEKYLSANPINMSVLNMLNAKYFIVPDNQGQPVSQQNTQTCGNAWFVKEIKTVADADAELAALGGFNPRQTVIVDKRFSKEIAESKIVFDSLKNKIELTKYTPDQLFYTYNAETPQIAVFSEIYYRGGIDWKAYIDGKEMPHFRANYLLRAMSLPAGKHQLVFKFDPKCVSLGHKIDQYASIVLFLFLGLVFFIDRKKI
ncbi:MAG: hypothetical protein KA313_05585 [Pseudarcicella sp.]|nr:hypothetical protein [Pseudarcicella sp.]MBP6410552.1 hypothetical protein [Pseudarcicella sp.]